MALTPEQESYLREIRAKVQLDEATPEELKKAMLILREERETAGAASARKKSKKQSPKDIDTDALLNQLL